MSDSSVTFTQGGGVIHAGPDAVSLYQAKVVRAGVRACRNGMRLNRAYTPTNVLRAAGKITGQTYKRGQYDAAVAGLDAWIAAMECAMPVVVESTPSVPREG